MRQEEWINFRNKIPKFDEFLENWVVSLNEKLHQHPIIDWLCSRTELYKVYHILIIKKIPKNDSSGNLREN